MDDEMKVQLDEYKNQLKSVEQALQYADGEQNTELLDLQSKLQEVISLLQKEQDILPMNNSASTSNTSNVSSIDDEFAQFQNEIKALEAGTEVGEAVQGVEETECDSESDDEANQQIFEIMASLEGTKCRAPFSQSWGEKAYYNALIVSVDVDPDTLQGIEDIEVRVMFCNPVCDQMKPCSFFLDGHCKFSETKCRFSHGHKVSFPELQEFVLPDFSKLSIDSKCLAKCANGLWQRATIEKCLKDNVYTVKFDITGRTETLEAECILPLDEHEREVEDEEKSFPLYEETEPQIQHSSEVPIAAPTAYLPLGVASWEKHSQGIGSKLMEKMGHVWGQGLGKNSDGRLEPIEAIILPTGKSLDKCIEMREQCNPKGPVAVETRLALAQDKEEQKVKRARTDSYQRKNRNVFDFINSKIAKIKDKEQGFVVRKDNSCRKEEKSNKSLNVQVFSVGEDIRKAKRELCKLHQSLQRNIDRNEVIRLQVEKKIATQNDILSNLQAKERRIIQDIKSQSSQKKLSVF